MKVAILSPQPRISGVVTYTHQLAKGFRTLGYECDIVTGTLSGKPSASSRITEIDAKRSGWGWSTLGSDITVKWADAVAALEGYDLIIVEEPRCAPLDKKIMRKLGGGDIKAGRKATGSREQDALFEEEIPFEGLPPYIQALAQLKGVKIATTLHDPGYMPRLAPFLRHFLDYVKPDLAITHRDGSYASAAWAGISCPELRIEHLPYTHPAPFSPKRITADVATTGRYINNKGQPTLFLAAALGHVPSHAVVAALGASPLGAGPNHTYLSFEGLTKRWGWVGTRDGGDVTRGWRWRATNEEGVNAMYLGPYMDAVDALRPYGLHVCMTDPAFSGTGSLEYAQLEAISAGCLPIMHHSREPKTGGPQYFEVDDISKLANAELWPVDEARERTAYSLGRAIYTANEWVNSRQMECQKVAYENYEIIGQAHAPENYARLIINALMQ